MRREVARTRIRRSNIAWRGREIGTPHTPYWIFTIPTEIVPDHGNIFTDRLTDFLMAFLLPLQGFSSDKPAMPMQKMRVIQPQSR
jgi:hypothetical protein